MEQICWTAARRHRTEKLQLRAGDGVTPGRKCPVYPKQSSVLSVSFTFTLCELRDYDAVTVSFTFSAAIASTCVIEQLGLIHPTRAGQLPPPQIYWQHETLTAVVLQELQPARALEQTHVRTHARNTREVVWTVAYVTVVLKCVITQIHPYCNTKPPS